MRSLNVYFNFTFFHLSYPIKYTAGGGIALALLGLAVHGIHHYKKRKHDPFKPGPDTDWTSVGFNFKPGNHRSFKQEYWRKDDPDIPFGD